LGFRKAIVLRYNACIRSFRNGLWRNAATQSMTGEITRDNTALQILLFFVVNNCWCWFS
jgi:hypothetical protein